MDWKNNLVDRKSVNFKGKEKLFLVEKKIIKDVGFLGKVLGVSASIGVNEGNK